LIHLRLEEDVLVNASLNLQKSWKLVSAIDQAAFAYFFDNVT